MGHQMVDFIADYFRDLETYPVQSQVQPGYLKKLLPESAPQDQDSLEDIFYDMHSKIFPGITHWQSPSFFAYYPSQTSTASILGEMLSASLSVVGFSWITSPAATELEIIVMDWLAKMLQLPSEFLSTGNGGGVIQGTACEAILVVMLAARKRAIARAAAEQGISEAEALGKLTVYTSDQAHACVNKASQLAGIATKNLRLIHADASTNYAVCADKVAKCVAADKAAGLIPFFLVGVIGTTSSAAVDPLSDLGDIAQEHSLWYHIDGAYAGNVCICPEYRPLLNGVEKADSFDMNLHKWFLTNFDCSCLWVKDRSPLLAALTTNPEYLRNKQSEANAVVDFKDWQIPLSRRFRALKLWMVLRMHGSDFLQTYLRSHCEQAKHFETLVRADSRFELMSQRIFSLVCFRVKPAAGDKGNGYTLNKKLVEALNTGGDIMLTHTTLEGVYTIRFAIGAARTEMRHIVAAWKEIQRQTSKLLKC